jgi:hypothetical protein
MSAETMRPSQAPPPPAPDEEMLEEPQDDAVMTVLASAMPWVISLLFHVGLFMVFFFFVFIVRHQAEMERLKIAQAIEIPDPGGRMDPGSLRRQDKTASRETRRQKFVKKESLSLNADKTARPLDIIGVGGGGASGGGTRDIGMGGSGSGGGPRTAFFGTSGNAHNVVYVIDRSGSMIDTFDFVRYEMIRSIGRLRDTQTFHVILFSTGNPIENPPKQLVGATKEQKKDASHFLGTITAEGSTNPVPALKRAFQVLRAAQKPGKQVFLLTDGVFPDNEQVLKEIAVMNPQKDVAIYTYLYGTRPPEAVDVMQKIAAENRGQYTFVDHEE